MNADLVIHCLRLALLSFLCSPTVGSVGRLLISSGTSRYDSETASYNEDDKVVNEKSPSEFFSAVPKQWIHFGLGIGLASVTSNGTVIDGGIWVSYSKIPSCSIINYSSSFFSACNRG